jgi:hypothetical protein
MAASWCCNFFIQNQNDDKKSSERFEYSTNQRMLLEFSMQLAGDVATRLQKYSNLLLF